MEQKNKKLLQFFSALADDTRLKILTSLVESPKTVNEIYGNVGKDSMTLSAISHQLTLLYNQDIITYEKKGRKKYFQLSDDFCWCILKDALGHFRNKCKCKSCSLAKEEVKKILR